MSCISSDRAGDAFSHRFISPSWILLPSYFILVVLTAIKHLRRILHKQKRLAAEVYGSKLFFLKSYQRPKVEVFESGVCIPNIGFGVFYLFILIFMKENLQKPLYSRL